MAEIMEDKNYGGRATGGLVTGIIGSALGLLNGGGGLNFIGNAGADVAKKDDKIDFLSNELMREKAERYTDQKFCDLKSLMYDKFEDVNASLCAQQTWNATNTANLTCINNQIAALNSLLTYGVASNKVISTTTSTT